MFLSGMVRSKSSPYVNNVIDLQLSERKSHHSREAPHESVQHHSSSVDRLRDQVNSLKNSDVLGLEQTSPLGKSLKTTDKWMSTVRSAQTTAKKQGDMMEGSQRLQGSDGELDNLDRMISFHSKNMIKNK